MSTRPRKQKVSHRQKLSVSHQADWDGHRLGKEVSEAFDRLPVVDEGEEEGDIPAWDGGKYAGKSGVGVSESNVTVKGLRTLTVGIFTDDNRPDPGTEGRVIFNTTDANLNIDNGTDWILPDGTVT